MKPFSYPKNQRLKRRKDIAEIFDKGHSFFSYPLLFRWILSPSSSASDNLLYGVSVPKRKIRKAVDRNTLKRRMRASFRQHKVLLSSADISNDAQLRIMAIYIAHSPLPYAPVESATTKGLEHIAHELS